MDITLLHDIPRYVAAMFSWATKQNGAVAFGAGAFAWFAVERVFGFVTNPIGKIMSLIGVVFVICFAVAMMTDFTSSYPRGTTPFVNSQHAPNPTTLKDLP
jgi:hypothetical protein